MSAFELWCKILEKRILSLFVGILLGSMSAFSQNLCLSGFDFGNSLAQGNKELWCSRNSCTLGWILVILWPKVTNNYGVTKIRVFLGWILAILWPKVTNNYGVPKILVFLHPENAQISCCG